jgi:ATP-dependent Clp protease ATP-binding subunit ClpC
VTLLGRGDEDAESKIMTYNAPHQKGSGAERPRGAGPGQNYVGTEHLLLALMHEREGVAAHVLVKLGLDLSKAREDLLVAIKAGEQGGTAGAKSERRGARPVLPGSDSGGHRRRTGPGDRPRAGD